MDAGAFTPLRDPPLRFGHPPARKVPRHASGRYSAPANHSESCGPNRPRCGGKGGLHNSFEAMVSRPPAKRTGRVAMRATGGDSSDLPGQTRLARDSAPTRHSGLAGIRILDFFWVLRLPTHEPDPCVHHSNQKRHSAKRRSPRTFSKRGRPLEMASGVPATFATSGNLPRGLGGGEFSDGNHQSGPVRRRHRHDPRPSHRRAAFLARCIGAAYFSPSSKSTRPGSLLAKVSASDAPVCTANPLDIAQGLEKKLPAKRGCLRVSQKSKG